MKQRMKQRRLERTRFFHEQRLWVVTAVFEDHVEAKKAFPEGGQASSFYDLRAIIAAIARKEGVDGIN
jgi:hypothetical protein